MNDLEKEIDALLYKYGEELTDVEHIKLKQALIELVAKARVDGRVQAYEDMGSLGAPHGSTHRIYAKEMVKRLAELTKEVK